jgi:UDP-glucose 6-dehydrogenase
MFRKIAAALGGKTIAVLGLTFKPNPTFPTRGG